MRPDSEKFLKALLNEPSPAGYEQRASKIFRNRLKGVVDQLTPDVHGNTIATLNPKAKFKFMLAGHIDEIGLITTYIDDKGFLYTAQIGGMDPSLLVGQRVKIMTAKGDVLGVIGRKAIHNMTPEERNKSVRMENVWVDIGAKDKKEAAKIVEIGDPMVVDVDCRSLRGDRIISRATDNKVSVYVVAEILRTLAKKKLKICVVGVATVQEEIGLRGATTSSYSVNPDAGIAFDVNFASDHPETDPKKIGEIKIGGGPNLHRGANINPILHDYLVKTAKAAKIVYQVSANPRGTGTDANAMQLSRGGVATALVSIPNRYMHTPVEMVSTQDLDSIVKLVSTFLVNHPANRNYCP
jgi:putative aminopeptidase FrvX